jgi:hypothetical protein
VKELSDERPTPPIGERVGRFWSSKQAQKQFSLFGPHSRKFRTFDGDMVEYDLMDSTPSHQEGYRNDPYPEYPDKIFLGYGIPVAK